MRFPKKLPGHSETGLRGMTAITDPSGHDEVLLAAVEGNAARIVGVNPRDGSEATELDLPDILRQHWGMPASTATGAVISSLARAMLALQVALASNP
jgi:hypothetical protein